MANPEVKIIITADNKIALDGIDKVKKKFNEMREVGEKISNMGMRISAVFTAPLVGLGVLVGRVKEVQDALAPIKEDFDGIVKTLAYALLPVIQDIMPVVREFLKHIRDLVNQFYALSTPQKEAILKFVLIAAAIGPVLVVVGQLIGFVGTLGSVLTTLGIVGQVAAVKLLPLMVLFGSIALLLWTINTYGAQAVTTLRQMIALAAGNEAMSRGLAKNEGERAWITKRVYENLGGNAVTSAPAPPTYITQAMNFNYSPMISTADRAAAEQNLKPIIQDAMRSFVPTR